MPETGAKSRWIGKKCYLHILAKIKDKIGSIVRISTFRMTTNDRIELFLFIYIIVILVRDFSIRWNGDGAK